MMGADGVYGVGRADGTDGVNGASGTMLYESTARGRPSATDRVQYTKSP